MVVCLCTMKELEGDTLSGLCASLTAIGRSYLGLVDAQSKFKIIFKNYLPINHVVGGRCHVMDTIGFTLPGPTAGCTRAAHNNMHKPN